VDLPDGGERLFLRQARRLALEPQALAPDADGARADEDDVVALAVEVLDGLADGGEVDEVEGVVVRVDERRRADFDDLLLFLGGGGEREGGVLSGAC
jgi:hypothetical protein